jgi:hypothetical protein
MSERYVPENLDEYSRLKIWGDQTRACLPREARGSLDDVLRHEPELRSMVVEGIEQLKEELQLGNKKLQRSLFSFSPVSELLLT